MCAKVLIASIVFTVFGARCRQKRRGDGVADEVPGGLFAASETHCVCDSNVFEDYEKYLGGKNAPQKC
jgi:hypothetical protein